jgi:hypothetical protein
MSKRKKSKKIVTKIKDLNQQITETVAGLLYTSETDAELIPFAGLRTDDVTTENLLIQIGKTGSKIEEKGFNEFFEPLIKVQDWFGDDERKMTEKFVELKKLLQQNLIEKKVFRVGRKEIDIYVVGLDEENILRGIQTRAVET